MPTNDPNWYRQYYLANRDRIRAMRRVYYLRNQEKLKQYQRSYYRYVVKPEKVRKAKEKAKRGGSDSSGSAPAVQESVHSLRTDNNDSS